MNREARDVVVEKIIRDAECIIGQGGAESNVMSQLLGHVKPRHITSFAKNPVVKQVGGIFMLGLLVFGIASIFDD